MDMSSPSAPLPPSIHPTQPHQAPHYPLLREDQGLLAAAPRSVSSVLDQENETPHKARLGYRPRMENVGIGDGNASKSMEQTDSNFCVPAMSAMVSICLKSVEWRDRSRGGEGRERGEKIGVTYTLFYLFKEGRRGGRLDSYRQHRSQIC